MILLCFRYDYDMFLYASVMFLKNSWFCFIMLLLYFRYTDNSYDSDDDIPISQLVLKRKAKAYEEEESLDDEQEEDEESNISTDDEVMWFRV